MDVATPPLQSGLLSQLLPELVDRVLYHADPADHLNFALTCKRLADCSQYVLRRHRDAYAKYGLCSDISHETVPALLRLVMRDPIVAWHIRSFEVWGARRSWVNWKQFRYMHHRNRYRIVPEDHEWDYGDHDPPVEDTEDGERAFDISTWNERVDHYFKRHELEGLVSYMQEAIGFSPSQAARAWEEIQQGNDGILKMLLFSFCPRLHSLKYADADVARSASVRRETAFARETSLGWLVRAVYLCRVRGAWPPGLQALRDVAIGVECGFGHGLHQPPILATSLFHLPGIKTLYLHGSGNLRSTDPDLEDGINHVFAQGIFALTPGCSSLEHVFFDNCRMMKDGAYHCFVAAPRSLVAFAARGGLVHDRRQWVSSAAKYQSKTLEAMMFYENGDATQDKGVYTAGLHKHFENLRCFHFHVAKVEEAMKNPNFPGSDMRQAVAFLVQWLRDELPRSAEVITFDCEWHPTGRGVDWNVIQLFDIVFASFVESGTSDNIKAAYFDRPFASSSRGSYFPNSFEAGLRYGVNIYIQGSELETTNIVSNRISNEHESYFPRPPQKYDLLTGPFASAERRVEKYSSEAERYLVTQAEGGRAFDPFRGDWVNVGNWGVVEEPGPVV